MRIVLSSTSGVPIYEQIKAQIRAAILSGEVAEGQALPSLRQLARDLKVSLISITRSYNDLAAEGLIVNVQGRGSFVLPLDVDRVRGQLMEKARSSMTDAITAARTARVDRAALHTVLDQLWDQQ
ncbi:MAG: GntR family transcriptional regulator [Micromonosporaceae bacterium]|nr:GntR family transcriptional regulator [Micromonosporaceae bacterium]